MCYYFSLNCVCASLFDNVIFHLSKHFVLLVQGTISVCSILGFLYNMICEDAYLCCTNRSHKTWFSSSSYFFVIIRYKSLCVTSFLGGDLMM